jgi:hypothetical protein
MEPSSKPGNDDADADGSADSRLGGGGGGSQLGLDDNAFEADTALARAAAPVPFGGGDDVDGGGAEADVPRDADAEEGELAKATVARGCAPLLARDGSGGGFTASSPAVSAFAAAISSGVTAGMRVESMRTAAICVDPSVESEYRPGDTDDTDDADDAGRLLWGSSPSGFSPGAREPDVELMRLASPGCLLSLAYPRAILGLRGQA